MTMQEPTEREVLEVGVIPERISWRWMRRAGATAACRDTHLKLGAEEVYSLVRDTNALFRAVA